MVLSIFWQCYCSGACGRGHQRLCCCCCCKPPTHVSTCSLRTARTASLRQCPDNTQGRTTWHRMPPEPLCNGASRSEHSSLSSLHVPTLCKEARAQTCPNMPAQGRWKQRLAPHNNGCCICENNLFPAGSWIFEPPEKVRPAFRSTRFQKGGSADIRIEALLAPKQAPWHRMRLSILPERRFCSWQRHWNVALSIRESERLLKKARHSHNEETGSVGKSSPITLACYVSRTDVAKLQKPPQGIKAANLASCRRAPGQGPAQKPLPLSSAETRM